MINSLDNIFIALFVHMLMHSTEYRVYAFFKLTDRHNLSICTIIKNNIFRQVYFEWFIVIFFCSQSRSVSFRLGTKDSGKDVLE